MRECIHEACVCYDRCKETHDNREKGRKIAARHRKKPYTPKPMQCYYDFEDEDYGNDRDIPEQLPNVNYIQA